MEFRQTTAEKACEQIVAYTAACLRGGGRNMAIEDIQDAALRGLGIEPAERPKCECGDCDGHGYSPELQRRRAAHRETYGTEAPF